MSTHPVPRLLLGENNFTMRRVRDVLQGELKVEDGSSPPRFSPLNLRYEEYGPVRNRSNENPPVDWSADALHRRMRSFCSDLAMHLCRSNSHLQHLDAAFKMWINCSFDIPVPEDEIVGTATKLLTRLPACCPPLPKSFLEDLQGARIRPRLKLTDQNVSRFWSGVDIAQYLDTNTIRIAISVAIQTYRIDTTAFSSIQNIIKRHLDNMVAIIDNAQAAWSSNVMPELSTSYVELIAFAWTSWQRSLTLVLTDRVRERLAYAFTTAEPEVLAPHFVNRHATGPTASANLPSYLCPWSFGLLRTNRCARGGDFRTILARADEYCQRHGHTKPQCIQQAGCKFQQCSGDTIEECMRFTDLKVPDQSMHTVHCRDHERCDQDRLYWDPISYIAAKRGRAVDINAGTDEGKLKYVSTSDRTLVITHVWSHGQGGRPEPDGSGFNRCLHDRYCRIGRAHACDSYWIDTTSIPNDYGLRNDAIGEINNTFANAKITLVCDKNLMEFDMSSPTIEMQEQLLSMVLLCDWNVRAWTFLEAMRGRNNLHLLCKDERIVSVKSLLFHVLDHGSLDLISLFADTHHLIPRREESSWSMQQIKSSIKAAGHGLRGSAWQVTQGFIGVEEAACLLSRRHATRPGDEIVIWSLLGDGEPHKTAEAFWHDHQIEDPEVYGMPKMKAMLSRRLAYETVFQTGALVSSAPRMQTKGLRWAPARPVPEAQLQLDGRRKACHPVDGEGSRPGILRSGGLEATWLIAPFVVDNETEPGGKWWRFPFNGRHHYVRYLETLDAITIRFLSTYKYGAFIRAARALGQDGAYDVYADGGRELVVIAGSDTGDKTWTWLGVVEWPSGAGIPRGELQEILLD